MRVALQLILLLLVLGQTGCLGLIRAILYPVEVAKEAAGSVAYNVAENLAGGGIDQTQMAMESLNNVERMIEEHPDAANMASLERIRDHLKEEVGAVPPDGFEGRLEDQLDPIEDGEVDASRIYDRPVVDNEHDRQALGFLQDPDGLGHAINKPTVAPRGNRMDNSLAIEMPAQPVYKPRYPTPRYFTPTPRQSSLARAEREFPMIYLDEKDAVQWSPTNRLPPGSVRINDGEMNR